MKNSVQKTFSILLLIAIVFISIQLFVIHYFQTFPMFDKRISLRGVFSLLYLWIPGFVSLIFLYKEKETLRIFKRPNYYLYIAPFVVLVFGLIAVISAFIFNSTITLKPVFFVQSFFKKLEYLIFYLVVYYVLFIIVFGFFFLGGELYLRGYLWEKLKSDRYKAVWSIALIWSLWLVPFSFFSNFFGVSNWIVTLIFVFLINFALSPILLYYRILGKSILTSTIFYSSLQAVPIFFNSIFNIDTKAKIIYSSAIIVILVVYSLFLNLYSKSFWKDLKE